MKTYRAITGILHFSAPLQTSSGLASDLTDSPLRRDVQGRVYIPGTSLAGALRSLATRVAPRLVFANSKVCNALFDTKEGQGATCGCVVCALFGDIYQGDDDAQESHVRSHASRLWIYAAYPTYPETASQYRDGVGIERSSRVSARQGAVKFDREQFPSDRDFNLHLELDPLLDEGSDELRLLHAVLIEWQAGRGRLGGRSSQGGGVFRLVDLKSCYIDLRSNLMTYLLEDKPWLTPAQPLSLNLPQVRSMPEVCLDMRLVARTWAKIEFDLCFDGPFLNNDPIQASVLGTDHAPWLSNAAPYDLGQAEPMLAGASLRGVLRSHAERIARTRATLDANDASEFLQRCSACDVTQSSPQAPLASCDALLDEEKIIRSEDEAQDEHLCLACQLFGSVRRASRLQTADAPLVGKPRWKLQDFLAIDRFTGGGLDGAKFDALALWKPRFSAQLFLENPQAWELGWLSLVLRDLNDGLLSFGFGAAKGYGRAHAEEWRLAVGYLDDQDRLAILDSNADLNPTQQDGLYQVLAYGPAEQPLPAGLLKSLAGIWFNKVKDYERTKLPPAKKDTYFDHLMDLYPKEVHYE